MPAPDAFGLQFEDRGPRRGGELRLYVAEQRTPEFDQAYTGAGYRLLREAGFGLDQFGDGVCWWERRDTDHATVAALIAEAPRAAAAEREERARREAAYQAEREAIRVKREAARAEQERIWREENAARVAKSLRKLRDIAGTLAWAVHHSYAEDLARLAAQDDLDQGDLARAERIIKSVTQTVTKAVDGVQSHRPGPEDLALGMRADMRRLAILALEFVTGLDQDHASELNSIGWSKSTSGAGHVLSLLAAESPEHDLTPSQAAHAIALVRRHAAQVPGPLQQALLGRVVPPRGDLQKRLRERFDAEYRDLVRAA